MIRNCIFMIGLILAGNLLANSRGTVLNEPDSAFLFAYAKEDGRSGLLFAWSIDQVHWHSIGEGYRFLGSDFGQWGTQKRMYDPFLFQDNAGLWHCVWSLNDTTQQVAHAASSDLCEWDRQAYPVVMVTGNVMDPEVSQKDGNFVMTWESNQRGETGLYELTTPDWVDFASTRKNTNALRKNSRQEAQVDGQIYRGTVNRVSWKLIDHLIRYYSWVQFEEKQRGELMADDPLRFAKLSPVVAEVRPLPEEARPISDMLIGVFFEDINYAADGGLYAELIQNRDFEYDPADRGGRDPQWNHRTAWSYSAGELPLSVSEPLHANNPNYAVLEQGNSLVNAGFDGIALRAGEQYNFSIFAKMVSGSTNSLLVKLTDPTGKVIAHTEIKKVSGSWKKYEAALTASATVPDARLEMELIHTGKVGVDMISLFPQKTFRNRKNGLRQDLAQTIADLHPRFVRFPGGCVAHGDGLQNIYRWKNSIGPLESRVPMRNIWGYHQSLGLGYYEYFQFCEDIGAEPLPVLAAGVPCQNSATGGAGQQCGIPMEEMQAYIQEIFDLIEWANGDKNSEWGSKRAAAGHPKPFNLKYIGIGNEDQITDVFEERFTMIYEAVKAKYPELTVIGTVGPFSSGTDYREGWKLARELDVPVVDEHYYQPPGWFINNQDFYDTYDRSVSKVYLGEYAAHVPGRANNMETALAEALYLTAVERNADVVTMTSYAPLLAKDHHTQWNPDLIYFNNSEVRPTVGYEVQKLYGTNSGDRYMPVEVQLSDSRPQVSRRIGVSVVEDSETGTLIVKLANLLPEKVAMKMDVSELVEEQTVKFSVLTGEPTDRDARPSESKMQIGKQLEYDLPAYSFTVFRMKKK